jgi:diguanylate cyclase (GGDEF)-like protein/PAS domain S-box-containing protein
MSSRFSLSRSLKTRVTLYTLAIFIFSLWSLSFYSSQMLQDDMQRVLGEQQFSTASRIAAEINDRLSDRIAALELIAKEMDAQLIGNPAALQARLEQRPILTILFNSGTWVSAQEGIVIASNWPVLIGTNYSDRAYLITALKGGKSAISKPITGKVLKDPLFLIAVPIHDAVGKVIGAIAGATDLSKTNFLDKSAKGQYGKSGGFLLNAPQHRLIVTATDKARIMQPLPPPGVNKMLDRYIQGYEGYGLSVNSRGVEELTAAKGIPVAGWFIGVVMPTAEAFAPVHDMQQRMLLATILLTLLAGGLTWWMLRMQLAPMLNTARTMARIATTKQPLQALPINHQDEVGDMVAGFNLLLESWRHSESRFKLIFNDAPFGMALVDSLTGKIHEVNPKFAKIARSSVAQMLELDWTSANQPHYLSEDRHNMAMLNAGKISGFQMEKRYLHEDGTPIWINMTIAAFEVEDKRQPRHICMVEDISERKQAEAAFRESERRFHGMANSAPVLIWLAKTDKLCHWFNEVWLSFTGRTLEQEMGNGWTEGVHPDDLERCLETYVGAFDARQEFKMEYRLRRFDGEYRWLIGNGLPRHDDQGTFLGYYGSCIDITERKRTEALLQVSLRLREYGLRHSLDELLTQTLDEAELLTGSEIGFFHFLETDQKTLWLQDWSTRTLREMCTAEGKMQHYSVDQAGVWVDCIHERRPVIHNDYASLPHRKGLPEGHAPVKRELVVPIMRGELIVAILGVGNKAVNYDQRDVEAVSRIADIAWDVVAARRVEHELVKSRNLLAETERIGKVGGWEFDIDSGKQAWTEEVYRIHEVALDLGPTLEKGIDFYAPDCRARVQEVVRRVIEHGEPFDIDSAIITAKGNRRDVHVVGRPDLEHRRIFGFIQDITERKQMEDKVRQLAFHDALTGLPNRRLLLDRLEQALVASQRNESFGALMFLDLDNFKPLNDQHGHGAGDLLLVEVAHRLRECVRAVDTVARIGGDEFVVLVCGLTTNQTQSTEQAKTLAEKICVSLAQPYLLQSGSELGTIEHYCSASIGVVLIEPQHQSVEGLLKWADATMYRAKAEGRNRVTFMRERRAIQRS